VGSGVEYTSGGGCSALGIAGRSVRGDGIPASSSPAVAFHLDIKLGLRGSIDEKDTRPEGLRFCGVACDARRPPSGNESGGEASSTSSADSSSSVLCCSGRSVLCESTLLMLRRWLSQQTVVVVTDGEVTEFSAEVRSSWFESLKRLSHLRQSIRQHCFKVAFPVTPYQTSQQAGRIVSNTQQLLFGEQGYRTQDTAHHRPRRLSLGGSGQTCSGQV
jgi:hypothetical protein